MQIINMYNMESDENSIILIVNCLTFMNMVITPFQIIH